MARTRAVQSWSVSMMKRSRRTVSRRFQSRVIVDGM